MVRMLQNEDQQKELEANVTTFQRMKPEEKGKFVCNVANPGGWPLDSRDYQGKKLYVIFGLPPLPIMMRFELNKSPVYYVTESGFRVNTGQLPTLPTYHLRRFLNHDPDESAPDQEADNIEAAIVLVDKVKATPLNVSVRYYGTDCNPLEGLAMPGYMKPWWNAMRSFLVRQRQSDTVSPARAATILQNFVSSGIESHRGSILSGAYHSTRVSQGYHMISSLEGALVGKVACGPYVQTLRKRVPASIRHDPSLATSFIFFSVWEDYNRDAVLNGGNLEAVIEMNVSSMGWMMGLNNNTHKWYFQGFQVMGGCGHYRMNTKDGVVIDCRKRNGSGMDFAAGKANMLFITLGEYLNISEENNRQTFVNANRWTPNAIENQGSVEVVNGNVVGLPNEDINKRPIMCTELRDASLGPLIKGAFPRNDRQSGVTLVTVDPHLTNIRPTSVKFSKFKPNFCVMSTNVACDTTGSEQWKSIMAVTGVLAPGAPAFVEAEDDSTEFHHIRCDRYQSRDRVPEKEPRRSILTLLLAQSHVTGCILAALVNQAGVIPFEIPESVLGYLDWLFLYIRTHVSCVLETDIVDSFGRFKEGYEARHVTYSLYKTVMELMGKDLTPDKVVLEANLRMVQCAMPPSEVRTHTHTLSLSPCSQSHTHSLPPSLSPCFQSHTLTFRLVDWQVVPCAHAFLTRGVNNAALVMTCCLLRHFDVPIIAPLALREFFTSDQV